MKQSKAPAELVVEGVAVIYKSKAGLDRENRRKIQDVRYTGYTWLPGWTEYGSFLRNALRKQALYG